MSSLTAVTRTFSTTTAAGGIAAKTFAWLAAVMLAGLAPASLAASKIYKTLDKDGNVVYTDVAPKQPEQAKEGEIKLPELNEFANPSTKNPPAATENTTPEDDDEEPSTVQNYVNPVLTFPANDQAVRANSGSLTLQASFSPALDPQHQLRFFVDGRPVGTTRTSSLTVNNIDRGTHQAQFVIIDEAGAVIAQSPSHQFHVLRVSVL